ncbi:hypothetical protein BD413DRAFT_77371 [Trametes elegans]|nr:hypothetical protein BD413DRAFT_77371 [Trametes elegans]
MARRKGGKSGDSAVPVPISTPDNPGPVLSMSASTLGPGGQPTPASSGEPAAITNVLPRVVPFWERLPQGNTQSAFGASTTPSDTPSREKAMPLFGGGRSAELSALADTTWEEVGQYALNASILSGRFEDLCIVAPSKRSSMGTPIGPRPLHANRALLSRALSNVALLLGQEQYDNTSSKGPVPTGTRSAASKDDDYGEDSDLEDDLPDGTQDEDPQGEAKEHEPQVVAASATQDPNAHGAEEPRETTSVCAGGEPDVVAQSASETACGPLPTATQQAPPSQRSGSTHTQQPTSTAHSQSQVIVVSGAAYRTWRTLVFYAYTHTIAFAPLKSQRLPFAPVDDPDDARQLPICSPKSMYRLAVKYGNADLETLAGTDVASKLSTQNVLDELFSRFTSRYPKIREMELEFLLKHIKHPDITVRMPCWVDRFACGELKECAETFGALISKLACATVASPALEACPRGCAMPTVQHRCSLCGHIFH